MANSNRGPVASQVELLQRRFAQAPGLPFGDLLSAELIARLLAEHGGNFNDRIYTPAVTLAMFLSQVCDPDPSLNQAVARLITQRLAQKLPACSSNSSAYSRARQRLPEELFAELTRHTGNQLMREAPTRWRWHGRHVKVVDGSTASMPDTEENQHEYPQMAAQKPGLGFPIVRFVTIFSLSVGTVLAADFRPYTGKETSELAMLRGLHDSFEEGDILLGDRHFGSFFEIAELQRRGIDGVFRQHQLRKTDFRKGVQLGPYDHLVVWQKPARPEWMDQETYDQYPAELGMREVRLRIRRRGAKVRTRVLTIATTLCDARVYRKSDLLKLYRRRWDAELNLRSLKTVLQMDVLRGKTPAMVRKEIWTHFLAYNLIRKVMTQTANKFDIEPWKISFKGALQTLNAFAMPLLTCAKSKLPEMIDDLLLAIARHGVGNRPNRVEPRALKRRPKPYDLLNKPRKKARKLEIQNTCG